MCCYLADDVQNRDESHEAEAHDDDDGLQGACGVRCLVPDDASTDHGNSLPTMSFGSIATSVRHALSTEGMAAAQAWHADGSTGPPGRSSALASRQCRS
jgi:hypothetical protein